MAIPTNDFLEQPYSDERMDYDIDLHRYKLTVDRANWLTGLDLLEIWNGQDILDWYLEYVARVAYAYIYALKDTKYKLRMEYYLSHSKYMREALEEFMVDIVAYNHEDGGFLVAYQTGINLKEMTELPMNIKNAVGVVGAKIAENYGFAYRYLEYDFDVDNQRGVEW